MKQEEISKAFEGRWRVKSQYLAESFEKMLIEYRIDHVKRLCRDFFEAGVYLGEGEHCPPIPMSAIENAAIEVLSFEIFWDRYDKKVGRPKCEKLWSKLTIEERKMCLDYIPLYKQAQPEKCYRKNPETFLRNKSWNDELIFKNNGTDNKPPKQSNLDKLADILTT